MFDVSWGLVLALASTGVVMALISVFVGMRPRTENPAWWALYAVWIAVVLSVGAPSPFWTVLLASTLAGLLHGSTVFLLVDKYVVSNPWHAERTKGPRGKLARIFVVAGLVVGVVFGAVMGLIAWALS